MTAPPEMPDWYKPKDEEDAAAFARHRVGTEIAAACAVGYMRLASW